MGPRDRPRPQTLGGSTGWLATGATHGTRKRHGSHGALPRPGLSPRPHRSHVEAPHDVLRTGVPTGALPSNTQWTPVGDTDPDDSLALLQCEGNWKQAEEEFPDVVQDLIDKEVEAGWVIRTSHTPSSPRPHGPRAQPSANLTWFSLKARNLASFSTARSATSILAAPFRSASPCP